MVSRLFFLHVPSCLVTCLSSILPLNFHLSGHPASHPFTPPPHWHYSTFRGVSDCPPSPPPAPQLYYPYAYPTVAGYAVVEGLHIMERRLPCCGICCGWFLRSLPQLP
ncbi:hypothetical protein MLD38_002304 [Melastoma candidum]|uniref:Uncharacterized protein n=1 Tax=Melastoma candidum TaxID=119954 RepID=A0ACB9SFI2_9MYRT|nr:hypothetical protein MLD38_002304 [Melastoma candidum]